MSTLPPDRETQTEARKQTPAHGGAAVDEFRQSLLDAVPAKAALIGADGSIVAVNRAWQELCAASADCLPGGDCLAACAALAGDEGGSAAASSLRQVLDGSSEGASFTYPAHLPDRPRWLRAHFAPIVAGSWHGAVVMHFDVTESMLSEQRLFQQAYVDSLTGLPNRPLLLDRLRHTLSLAARDGRKMAVMFVDMDRVKIVNDTLGHHIGDQLLQQFGRRLGSCVRAGDTVGRLGGDEFAVLLSELPGGDEAARVARTLLNALKQPFKLGDQDIFASASIGIAVYPDDAGDAETLLRFSDAAMYRAKEAGRGTYRFYQASMNARSLERLRLDADLRRALGRGEFVLHYQPKLSCSSGEIVAAEALLRWQHPQRGLVMPAEFIPVLEETGLIREVGEWALHQACAQLREWVNSGAGVTSVAVNLSARQLEDRGLLAAVRSALTEADIPPERLELELTESVLMRNTEQVIGTLAELRRLGVRLSVDDFGTGYSSLSYLKRFPVDSVKIDRSFVQDISADPDDASITRAVITMAHNLKLRVVAEGVETAAQLSILVASHCDEIQGYLFSGAVPAAVMEAMLRERRKLSPTLLQRERRQRTLLLVDDEPNILASLRRLLRNDGYQILTAGGGEQGLELLATNAVGVIVSDQRMPGMTGVEFLRRVKMIHPETVRIVLSGYTELQSITDAINEGAIYKFLTKPWDDALIRANIEEAFRHKELADENRRLHAEVRIANRELARANQRLQTLLDDKQRQLLLDAVTRDIAQEVLQQVPLPIVGLDDEGMVVFANERADALFGADTPLLGSQAEHCLDPSLQALLGEGNGASRRCAVGGQQLQAICHTMGEGSTSRGRLLIFMPDGAR